MKHRHKYNHDHKWSRFFREQSPARINNINTGKNNLLADWRRALDTPDVTINVNGKPLSDYAAQYNSFNTLKDIEEFIFKEILKELPSHQLDDFRNMLIVKYLMTSFHQGGFLNPVTAAVNSAMNPFAALDNITRVQVTNIVSTPNGFTVQEFLTAPKLVAHTEDLKRLTPEFAEYKKKFGETKALECRYKLSSPDSEAMMIEAQGILDVDFSKFEETQQPSITVKSNTIHYGHPAIKEKMDKRSLGQMIIDFLKNAFGISKVVDMSKCIKENDEPDSTSSMRI